nr:MAG TPA: hypothetical protein [Caudoviricetes sp.]
MWYYIFEIRRNVYYSNPCATICLNIEYST